MCRSDWIKDSFTMSEGKVNLIIEYEYDHITHSGIELSSVRLDKTGDPKYNPDLWDVINIFPSLAEKIQKALCDELIEKTYGR